MISVSENRPAMSATSDVPEVTAPAATPPAVPPAVEPAATPPAPSATPEPQGPIAARFGQLAAQRREAEARAERLERLFTEQSEQVKTLLLKLDRPAAPVVPSVPTDSSVSPRPLRDAFADAESYETALVSWAGDQAASRAAAELKRQQEEFESSRREAAKAEEARKIKEAADAEEAKRAESARATWEERKLKAAEKYPDFEAVTGADSLPITDTMGYMIVTREDGPEIAYYLGKNPQEAARIAALTVPGQTFPAGHPRAGLPLSDAVAQAFELGRIAAKLASAAPTGSTEPADEGSPPPVVSAVPTPSASVVPPVVLPAPPSPISGASAAATRRDPSEMSMDEYAAHRNTQLLAERRPGRIH